MWTHPGMIPGPDGMIETGASGRLYCPLINVAFQLRDAHEADGAMRPRGSPFPSRTLWSCGCSPADHSCSMATVSGRLSAFPRS